MDYSIVVGSLDAWLPRTACELLTHEALGGHRRNGQWADVSPTVQNVGSSMSMPISIPATRKAEDDGGRVCLLLELDVFARHVADCDSASALRSEYQVCGYATDRPTEASGSGSPGHLDSTSHDAEACVKVSCPIVITTAASRGFGNSPGVSSPGGQQQRRRGMLSTLLESASPHGLCTGAALSQATSLPLPEAQGPVSLTSLCNALSSPAASEQASLAAPNGRHAYTPSGLALPSAAVSSAASTAAVESAFERSMLWSPAEARLQGAATADVAPYHRDLAACVTIALQDRFSLGGSPAGGASPKATPRFPRSYTHARTDTYAGLPWRPCRGVNEGALRDGNAPEW